MKFGDLGSSAQSGGSRVRSGPDRSHQHPAAAGTHFHKLDCFKQIFFFFFFFYLTVLETRAPN